jgi:N-acetylated-alpha-linked acidic dipeptidase
MRLVLLRHKNSRLVGHAARAAFPAALAAVPLILLSAPDDSILGFDPASQAAEIRWEQQARAIPAASRIGEFIRKYSSQPHLAGTPQSKQTAESILAQLHEYGLEANIEKFEALLPTPKSRTLEMTEPVKLRMKLEEPAVNGDRNSNDGGMIPPYNAYSGDGDVTAPLVYANYGTQADYDVLKRLGADVRGKIVIVRYGRNFRGAKSKIAQEQGAAGCIIYSDPRDDGYYQGDAYPRGPFRPADGVQRGSVLDVTLYPGDPLSPGWASEPGSRRLALTEAQTVMNIPVLPISWADAQPLLANLEGPVAPETWRGGLPITYHLGAGPATVHLKVLMDNATRPLYNVIARIPGSQFPDQWLLDGNHHDAWVHGASDPLSGVAPLMETARTLAELTRKGWKPARTILLAFWDGEEFGLTGSTEWMEKHTTELDRSMVAYLNADSSGKGRLIVGGSHSLELFMQEIVRDVRDPVTARPLLEGAGNPRRGFRIGALGSGSDYTPFLDHLGIASLEIRFATNDTGVYHSDYDDFNWYSRFSDTNFVYGRTLAQLHTTALMRLADAPLLPFEFSRLSAAISRYLDEIDDLIDQTPSIQKSKPDLNAVRSEVAQLQRSAAELNVASMHLIPRLGSVPGDELTLINQTLFHTERIFASDPGLPGRPWYRHHLYAPGKYTGYDAKTLPGIREAVETGHAAEASDQANQLVEILRMLNDEVLRAQKMLGEL